MASVRSHPRSSLQSAVARLREHLSLRGLVPPARLPSGRALAAEYGLDFSTVNRALRELTARGVVRREGYKLFLARPPEEAAAVPAIHVLCPDPKAAAGAAQVAAGNGGRVIPVPWHWASYAAEVRRLADAGSEGLIVWTHRTPVDEALRRFARRAPVVAIGRGSDAVPSVETDTAAAASLAVGHLAALGHRELACLASVEAPPGLAEGYRRACAGAGLASSAAAERTLVLPIGIARLRHAWATFRLRHPSVTGLFIADSALARDFANEVGPALPIPGALSVVAYGEEEDVALCEPSLTLVAVDPLRMGRHAAALLLDRHAERAGNAPGKVLLPPRLLVRRSTTRPNPTPGTRSRRPASMPPPPETEAEALAATRRTALALGGDPYPRAVRKGTAFRPLDLAPLANHALDRYRGWLGQFPLLHWKGGRRTVHGVPFELLDGRGGRPGAVVLGSAHARRLPSRVALPVGARIGGAYFLHGCGWAADHAKFAAYRFLYEDGGAEEAPLVPYGLGPADPALRDEWARASTIQDWWPSFSPFRNDRARPLAVTGEEAAAPSGAYLRCLYTLEWANPHPERPVAAIEVVSNPEARATLGLLAMTLLAPEGGESESWPRSPVNRRKRRR